MTTKNPEPLAAQLEEVLSDWTCAHNAAATLRSQYVEIEALKKALNDAATSLETISRLSGRKTYGDPPIETYMDTFMDVRLYAASRANAARQEMAAALDTKGA